MGRSVDGPRTHLRVQIRGIRMETDNFLTKPETARNAPRGVRAAAPGFRRETTMPDSPTPPEGAPPTRRH